MIECSASLVSYHFSSTRLINSMKHEHSCKILCLFHSCKNLVEEERTVFLELCGSLCSVSLPRCAVVLSLVCDCVISSSYLSNTYTIGCPPVRGDNPYVQVDKHCVTILYHLHQCRPCISRDKSC